MNHTPEEHAEILRSYIEHGKRMQDFTRDYELDDRYVSAIVLRFKIQHTDSGRHRRTTESHLRKWASLYEEGRSMSYIAKVSGTSTSLVSAYLRAYEIKQGDPQNVNPSSCVDRIFYKLAAMEAAAYWKDRCERHYKFWEAQAQSI